MNNPVSMLVRTRLDLPPTLVQVLRNFSGLVSLFCELLRGQVPKARVWSVFVVVDPTLLDPLPGVTHGQDPWGIQTLGPKAGIERLDIGIVRWFPWPIVHRLQRRSCPALLSRPTLFSGWPSSRGQDHHP